MSTSVTAGLCVCRNPVEYGHELEHFDEKLGVLLHKLKNDDLLIITTDHGNGPTYTGSYKRKGIVLTYSKSIVGSIPLEKADTFSISEPQSQTISASECLNTGALDWQNSIDCVRIALEKGRNHMVQIIFILISFLAYVIGCICGIGGGVIIKPVMDAFGLYSVSSISFMSGCIVLSMTAYSFLKAQLAHESVIEKGVSTYLGIGAALGGLIGKQLFDVIERMVENTNTVGAVQAAALFTVTLGTAVYTVFKVHIRTHQIKVPAVCALIGLCLGMLSSFLGIGGGPVNLVVLYFFFSMETKIAAQNSLYIILFSQATSLLFSVLTGKVPKFPMLLLACMVCCGILGGVAGRKINKKINSQTVSKLFFGLLIIIMGICCYNFFRYS